MEKISVQQIKDYLQSHGIQGEVIQLHDTLGNQQVFRVKVKGKLGLRQQNHIKQLITNEFHTKITDISFSLNENLHFDYNGSHMLVYDIERKYNNILSGKLQISIDGNVYGYDILFDDMKGIIEWDQDFHEINKDHDNDGTSRDFKGLIDMFNISLQNHVNIEHHIKPNPKAVKKNKDQKAPQILINYDQAKGRIAYVLIKGLSMASTAFNKLIQELSSQGLYITYDKRKDPADKVPTEIFIGRSGGQMSDNDMTNMSKILSKNGVDATDYEFVNVSNLNMLPASALIKTSLAGGDDTTTL